MNPRYEHGFDLDRFVSAQEPVYATALAELRAGRKRTHWIWFVFPQIAGLGCSSTARFFAISGLEEARQYLSHPLLGPRLIECTEAMLAVRGRGVSEILGFPDDLKFRSSMTLFAEAAEPGSVFERALAQYFHGRPDARTLALLGVT